MQGRLPSPPNITDSSDRQRELNAIKRASPYYVVIICCHVVLVVFYFILNALGMEIPSSALPIECLVFVALIWIVTWWQSYLCRNKQPNTEYKNPGA